MLHSAVEGIGGGPSQPCTYDAPLGGPTGLPLGYHVELTRGLAPKQCAIRMHGSYLSSAGGACVTYHALVELCIKVSKGGDGCWRPDDWGGGCDHPPTSPHAHTLSAVPQS